jgi:hypothetical protein
MKVTRLFLWIVDFVGSGIGGQGSGEVRDDKRLWKFGRLAEW